MLECRKIVKTLSVIFAFTYENASGGLRIEKKLLEGWEVISSGSALDERRKNWKLRENQIK